MTSTSNIIPPPESFRFRSLFEVALKEYAERTGTDLASHPLFDKLRACESVGTVIDVVEEQAQAFGKYRKGDRTTQLVTKLKPLVDTMLVLNDGLGDTLGEAFKPAKYVCAGVGLLLRASKGVSESYDTLVDLFDTMSLFLERVKVYTRVEPTPPMTEIVVKLMIGMLDILGLATKEMKQGRLRAFGKKLLGSKKIEEVVKRLDRLTLEESRISTTHILTIVHTLLENFKGVMTNAETFTVTMEDALASIQQIVDDANKNKRDKLYEKCTKWLSPPDPFSNHSSKREHWCHKGSTDWFIHGNAFGDWTVSDRSFLWLHGKPGSGKSVLYSAIIDHCIYHLRRTGLGTVAFFYCDFQDTATQSLNGILRSILVQLCQQSDLYWEILSRFYTDNKDHPPSTDALAQCLKTMLSLPNEAAKYIFVDALDECPNSGMQPPRGAILNFLKDIIESRLSDVHICVTSRPEGDIAGVLERPASFRVSLEEEIGQEYAIVNFIESSVESHPRMSKWSKTIKDLVVDKLRSNAHGMFRYVYCQLEELCDLHPANIPRTLETLPKTLYESYESTLRRIPEGSWESAHRIFQCVSFSKRPLSVEELVELLVFDFEGYTPTYHSDWRAEDAHQALLSFCPGSFLSIVEIWRGSEVRFAHFSVQEFLTSAIIENSPTKIYRFRLLPRPSHTLLAQICLTTLLQIDADSDRDPSEYLPLFDYAVHHWDEHVRFEDVALSVMDMAIRALDLTLPRSEYWLRERDDYPLVSYPPTPTVPYSRPTALHLAACHDIQHVVEHIAKLHPGDVDQVVDRYGSPLDVASLRSHTNTVRSLLSLGANPNTPAGPNGTALQVACLRGYTEVCQLLLDHGADPNAPAGPNGTALQLACSERRIDITQLLLDRGADPNAPAGPSGTALQAACRGNINITQLLLDRGADPNAPAGPDGTALQIACLRGKIDITQLLFDHGADPNATAGPYGTALQVACYGGHVDGIQLLLDRGADPNAPAGFDGTALQAACRGGEINIAQLLLERGADPNARAGPNGTALHIASSLGSLSIVQLLLNHGADVSAWVDECGTALEVALRNGHTAVADLLSTSRGIDSRRGARR